MGGAVNMAGQPSPVIAVEDTSGTAPGTSIPLFAAINVGVDVTQDFVQDYPGGPAIQVNCRRSTILHDDKAIVTSLFEKNGAQQNVVEVRDGSSGRLVMLQIDGENRPVQ